MAVKYSQASLDRDAHVSDAVVYGARALEQLGEVVGHPRGARAERINSAKALLKMALEALECER